MTIESGLQVTHGHHSLNGSSDSVNGDLQFLWENYFYFYTFLL